ncbi:hypothetical protein HKD37_16G045650 [Glycine soja]
MSFCFLFSLFRAALPSVRGGSNVERSGEGEVSGVKLCGGWWRQTRYADGMDEDEWMYEIMSERADMDYENAESCGAKNHMLIVRMRSRLLSIARTPDGILNLLKTTMTPTHDAMLYYNGRWNMSRQNEFVGYSFTGKNPKNFDISTGCTMDELKDLIKQVAPRGIPPYGVDET